MKNGYITQYFNEQNCLYDKVVYTNKKEALKKNGATRIRVIKCNYDSIYYGDNYSGWCTDDKNANVIKEG